MSRKANQKSKRAGFRILTALLVWAFILTITYLPIRPAKAAGNQASSSLLARIYQRPAPQFDLNKSRALKNMRTATGAQLSALDKLKTATGSPNATARWNDFGGSIDVVYDFASQPFSGTPEEAGRAFISQNAALFGISDLNNLQLFNQTEAGGGYLLRFKQTFNGIDVKDGGIGLVLNGNKQVIMASGPFFRDVNVNTTPTISAEQAKSTVDADLAKFHLNWLDSFGNIFQSANQILNQQFGAINNEQPRLGIYPTADGYRLVWKVAKFSTNPFGVYLISVDAQTGELVARKDYVAFQQAPQVLPLTADIYPKYPTITDELKNKSIISDCNGTPCGQERVSLRNFDSQNVATGLNGTLTGAHAIVNNALYSKQPFAQAALGTWHFRQDNPTGFEARTNEQDNYAEPAEHQDDINAFFFVNYLIEYVDYLHVAGDNNQFGGGAFPDDYPNKTVPLPATVHMPDVFAILDIALNGNVPDPTNPELTKELLGMDNAFAVPVSALFADLSGVKMPIVVNPTFYGHGYLFNDTALEGTVPYHEGMHSITTPIAGLEGGDEASAMNEGQADMWAFTITNNPSLGDYVVNAKGFREYAASRGRNPDSIAYIRSARSTLKYSDIGTLMSGGVPVFEEHYDGEIFMSTMWDIREMLNRVYPDDNTYKRPQPKDGKAEKKITQGTNIFERDFLMAMYILGTTAPDTYVKARDAMIVADKMLYPAVSTDPNSPGTNRALIEQTFAAHEMGVNAQEVNGGRATISTQVTPFAGDQPAPAVPTNVQLNSDGPRALRVSWDGVQGAVAYEVLKRKIGFENRRQPNGKREYADGDASTTGFRHVAYVDGNQLTYTDKGAVHEVFAPEGLNDLFDSEYVVRAIGVNANRQLGWSNFSGASHAVKAAQDLTTQIDWVTSNPKFTSSVSAFDTQLVNSRGAFSFDKIAYGPIQFQIQNISNPTVTVKNADQSGNTFIYDETLPLGATSKAKRFEFNNPGGSQFNFDVKIVGNAFFSTTIGTGSQNSDGTSEPPAPITYSIFREEKTGNLVVGEPSSFVTGDPSPTYGDPTFKGITWDDIEVVTKSDAQFLDATLSSTLARDLDLDLLTEDGKVIASSAGGTADEHFLVAVQPNTRYFFRVKGWANGPCDYKIVSDQLLPNGSPNANAGTRTIGGGGALGGNSSGLTGGLTKIIRFTVDPLTKTVTAKFIK